MTQVATERGTTDVSTPGSKRSIFLEECAKQVRPIVMQGFGKARVFVQHNIFNTANGIFEWPDKTNIHCWHHKQQFSDVPRFIVTEYDSSRQLCSGYGVFCSPNCAKGYLVERPGYKNTLFTHFIDVIETLIFGNCNIIVPAAEMSSLACFGGPYDEAKFKEKFRTANVFLHRPHMITRPMVYEERPVDATGGECDRYACTPISSMTGENGVAQWNVRGLKIPRKTQGPDDKPPSVLAKLAKREPAIKQVGRSIFQEYMASVQEKKLAAVAEDDKPSDEVEKLQAAKNLISTKPPPPAPKEPRRRRKAAPPPSAAPTQGNGESTTGKKGPLAAFVHVKSRK